MHIRFPLNQQRDMRDDDHCALFLEKSSQMNVLDQTARCYELCSLRIDQREVDSIT